MSFAALRRGRPGLKEGIMAGKTSYGKVWGGRPGGIELPKPGPWRGSSVFRALRLRPWQRPLFGQSVVFPQ